MRSFVIRCVSTLPLVMSPDGTGLAGGERQEGVAEVERTSACSTTKRWPSGNLCRNMSSMHVLRSSFQLGSRRDTLHELITLAEREITCQTFPIPPLVSRTERLAPNMKNAGLKQQQQQPGGQEQAKPASPPAKKARVEDFETILQRSKSQIDPMVVREGVDAMAGDKLINDCIHGTIRVPPVVAKIMDTPQFQRLRSIKQLGTCHMVYPNATHNRFQHSLGVAYLAEKFAKHLMENYKNLLDEKDVLCIMIAGLCHDLGHGPFSHLWESFIHEASPNSNYHHEVTSIKMLDRLLDENQLRPILLKEAQIDERDIIFIKEMIVGPLDPKTGLPSDKSPNDEIWPYQGREVEKSFLYEIVANKLSGIDVDKWDYFLRDDYYLKIGHVFGYERFINCCKIEKTGNPPRRRIIMREKEAEMIFEMYQDRRRLHTNGYQHRITKIADRMLIDAWLLANKHVRVRGSNDQIFTLSDASIKDLEAHEKLEDEFVKYKILELETANLDTKASEDVKKAQEILKRIQRRDFYLRVVHINILKEGAQFREQSDAQILEDLKTFIKNKYDQTNYANKVTAEDFSLVRTKVTSGIDINGVGFYFYDPLKTTTILKATAESLNLYIPDKNKHEIMILCKRREVGIEAVEAVKEWKKSKGIKVEEENQENNGE